MFIVALMTLTWKDISIWKGLKMSIAKAALIFYYEKSYEPGKGTLNYGNLDDMHWIIEIAWWKHQSFFSPSQVSNRLYQSPYWDKETIKWFYAGLRGHWKAVLYTPSAKGKAYYEKYLRS